MEVTYRMNPSDLEALTAFVHRGTVTGWLVTRWIWVAGVIAAWLLIQNFHADAPLVSVAPVVLVGGFLIFLWKRRHREVLQKRPTLFEPLTLAVTPDGLESRAEGRLSTVAWPQVRGFGETSSHVIVLLDAASGYIVPKRDLAAADAQALVAELGRYTRPLPRTESKRRLGPLGIVLLWLGVLVIIYLAWHFAGLQRPR